MRFSGPATLNVLVTLPLVKSRNSNPMPFRGKSNPRPSGEITEPRQGEIKEPCQSAFVKRNCVGPRRSFAPWGSGSSLARVFAWSTSSVKSARRRCRARSMSKPRFANWRRRVQSTLVFFVCRGFAFRPQGCEQLRCNSRKVCVPNCLDHPLALPLHCVHRVGGVVPTFLCEVSQFKVTRSAQLLSHRRGELTPRCHSRDRCTNRATSARCRSWRTHSKTPAAITKRC